MYFSRLISFFFGESLTDYMIKTIKKKKNSQMRCFAAGGVNPGDIQKKFFMIHMQIKLTKVHYFKVNQGMSYLSFFDYG